MQISVTHDLHKLTKYLNNLQRQQIPAATQWAMNNTVKLVKEAEEREIKRVYNNPTRYTQNSLWIKWARKTKLEALVKIKDESTKGNPASRYLLPTIEGRKRRHTGFERLLISKGMMPSGMYAVPSRTIKKNAYGNVSTGLLQKILSGLGAQRDIYQRATKGSGTHNRYFAGIIGNVHGIWDVVALHKGGPALLFLFVSGAPGYSKRFEFVKVAQKVINKNFANEFDAALKKALATAK